MKGVEGNTFETINPATEKVICSVHEATAADVDIAVAAARRAFEVDGWNKVTGANRGRLMAKLADLMERDLEILSHLESIDNGKALGVAKTVDVPMSADCIRYYSGWADKVHGQVIDPDPDHLCYTRIEPVGKSSPPPCILHLVEAKLMFYVDGCLWSNYSLELPLVDVGMEDRASDCCRERRRHQIR